MNGVHDMGGLQDFGPVRVEKNEPVFHADWERRIYGIDRSLRAHGKWNLDAWRFEIESLPPVDYLRMTYYERWLQINCQLAVKHGLLTVSELASGKSDPGADKYKPALTEEIAMRKKGRSIPSSFDPSVAPRFEVGQRVRARNINPATHTRLPRYARGKVGLIALDHGVYLLPDSNAHFKGEKRQHVYSVSFSAREIWGQQAPEKDTLRLDLWDDHLEHA